MKFGLKKKYNNMLLRHKISILLIVTLAVQILFSVVMNYTVVRNMFSKNSISYTSDVLNNLKSNIEERMKNVENVSQNIVYNDDINDVLEQNLSAADEMGIYETQKKVNSVFKSLSFPQNDIQTIVMYNANKYPYIMDINNNFEILDENMSRCADECRSAKPEWKYYNNGIILTRRIHNRDTLEKMGTLVIILKESFFDEIFNNMHDNREFMILSENGKQICGFAEKSGNDTVSETYGKYISGKNGHYINRKSKELVCFVSLKNTTWNVISVIPLKTLYKDVNRVNGYIMFFGLFGCAVLIVINKFFADSIEKPIAGLVKKMEIFKKENVLDTVVSERNDEIGYLEHNFNDMAQHLKNVIKTMYLERISRKNAYIKALQAQINPHFIYNTLENISWTARMNNDAEVSDMIATLARLMEVNFRKKEKQVSIEDEVSYIENYYKIIKFRFGDEVTFRYDISPETRQIKIPTLIIQPLVENSVNHGIRKTRRKGIVLIKTYIDKENAIIEVIDNGVGIDGERLDEINDRLGKSLEEGMNETDNIGIVNTSNRIKLCYGEEYGLEISTCEGHFCKITMCIPKN